MHTIGVVIFLLMTLLASVTQGETTYNTDKGILYRLRVLQDVTLERSTRNFDSLPYLIVSKFPQFPKNLPTACPTSTIKSAKMYLYYVYAHKASFHPITRTPFVPRYLQVHLVKKY